MPAKDARAVDKPIWYFENICTDFTVPFVCVSDFRESTLYLLQYIMVGDQFNFPGLETDLVDKASFFTSGLDDFIKSVYH